MEIRDDNGQMKIIYHPEGDINKFELIDNSELKKFAIDILSTEYKNRGIEILSINYNNNFSEPNIIKRSNGYPDVAYFVLATLTNEALDIDFSKFTNISTRLIEKGIIPRVAVASFWCYRGFGEKAYKGGDYSVKFDFITQIDDNNELNSSENLNIEELAQKFLLAWNDLDVSIISPYLSKNFLYSSSWVFDELPSRYEYLLYLEGKFNNLRDSNINPDVVINHINGKPALFFNQNGEIGVLELWEQNGLLVQGKMYPYKEDVSIDFEKDNAKKKSSSVINRLIQFLKGDEQKN